MAPSKSKFIVTSTAFLKALQNLSPGQEDVTFTVKKDKIIGLGPHNEYFANDISGEGTYTYWIDSIQRLVKCLSTLPEQPIVVTLDSNIWISDIMF